MTDHEKLEAYQKLHIALTGKPMEFDAAGYEIGSPESIANEARWAAHEAALAAAPPMGWDAIEPTDPPDPDAMGELDPDDAPVVARVSPVMVAGRDLDAAADGTGLVRTDRFSGRPAFGDH